MNLDLILILLPYLLAKGLVIWGEEAEFEDFPGSIAIGTSLVFTYFLLIFSAWNLQYRLLPPLLAISAFQLLAIKDGSYNAFLQSSALIGIFLLGIFLQRGLKRDFTGLACIALTFSTGATFLQSL